MEVLDILLAIARVALAVTFIVSGVAKLLDIPGSQKGVQNFGIPESLAKPLGILVPIVELILAVMLIPVPTATAGALGLLAMLVVFTAGISMNLARGKKESCHCFGQLSNAPIGKHSLVRNGILGALALFVGVSGLMGNPGPSLVAWTEGLSMFQWILLALLIIMGLVLAGVVWLLVHLLGQNGRLLVRMDAIEEALENADIDLDDDDDDDDEEDEEDEDEGLPIGSPAPAFNLTGLYGETSTLESMTARGKPVMLIFSDPGCGPCNSLMPQVGTWQKELSDKLTVALVSRGDLESNRQKANQHNLQNVVMQKDNEIADEYRTFGTPTGVLVWPNGLIASGAAGGGGAIKKVIDDYVAGKITEPKRVDPSAVQLKAPSRAQAGSENVGKPAPAVSLQDLEGNTVSLADFKGKDTALLFWNPGCGFCKRMEDDLKNWERNKPADAPELLIVSTGSVDDNRAHGFSSRIVLDSGFNTGRSFGASGTPSAVMVGADGTLKSGVAVGAPSVLGLLRHELPEPAPAPARGGGGGGNGGGGAKVGAAAPAVELKDLDGNTVKLSDFRGEPTALLFWNPGCGFCKRMEDDLKNWERDKPAGAPKLLIVSTGDAASNRAHGFQSPIVLDAGFNTGRAFGASGTPSAILVGPDGNVASSVAVGAPGVLGMLRGEAVPSAPAEPATPSIGDKAPVVRLPDLNGNMVDLADNAGSRTLILFWNPGCGFCKRMLDDLKAWEASPQPGAPKLIVVSTGSVEDNRAMGIQSPVVLDGNFSVGSAFGSNGTPSAILVDANGRVASALAVGGPNVMELAHSVD